MDSRPGSSPAQVLDGNNQDAGIYRRQSDNDLYRELVCSYYGLIPGTTGLCHMLKRKRHLFNSILALLLGVFACGCAAAAGLRFEQVHEYQLLDIEDGLSYADYQQRAAGILRKNWQEMLGSGLVRSRFELLPACAHGSKRRVYVVCAGFSASIAARIPPLSNTHSASTS